MWRPPIPINFLALHYAWIIFCSLLGIVVFLPYGNVPAIDAYFFGASASTESGLNTIDVKDLKTYQQLFLYFIPMFTNLGFINIIVVAVRLYWFERHIRKNGNKLLARSPHGPTKDVEAQTPPEDTSTGENQQETLQTGESRAAPDTECAKFKERVITFSADANPPPNDTKALYVPPPKERDNGTHAWILLLNARTLLRVNEDILSSKRKPKINISTMVDNLGFTLTPDSMITFRDAVWPMLAMSFLAFAGNTCYPVVLRLVIWTMSKLAPKNSSMRETLQFLLEHPRRCYTLLFPSNTTWILFGILFTMNFIDVVLIVTLDLDNPEVNSLPMTPRIFAAIFQAASSRHTGTATFNLAKVNPGVQFSLLVMMYIAILPIAISMRSSNTYEETSLGFYAQERALDESRSSSYVMTHIRNQLSFDLWYVFLGTFCICVTEADKVMDLNDPAFSVFAIFFEVMSAYGNVGLSLGHPDVMTSLSGKFRTFSKVVICAMMIRGRHRGLPYALDRAIMLPDERRGEDGREVDAATKDQ
ncbi:hypothetical protein DL770_000224 [Monosporascus sp. CRB-9-2]|nr:hypothetical protein DL770_000224 [Monosporascus sp. CRB-9-2]